MARTFELSQKHFDEILEWLDPDREQAGIKYEELRLSLIRILSWNGCVDVEAMVDETVDRVASKVHELKQTFEGDPRLYFYGVANNLVKEYKKTANLHVPIEDVDLPAATGNDAEDAEAEEHCLQTCLRELSCENRELILDYYKKDKHDKIVYRKEMAQRLGVPVNALRVRMHRVRATLEDCINRCCEQFSAGKMK
jgi:RNA polymerase sigma factor (sigma-70 family)